MDITFRISAPESPTTGDFLSFTVYDGDKRRAARITGTALAPLGDLEGKAALFQANEQRIAGSIGTIVKALCRAHA